MEGLIDKAPISLLSKIGFYLGQHLNLTDARALVFDRSHLSKKAHLAVVLGFAGCKMPFCETRGDLGQHFKAEIT